MSLPNQVLLREDGPREGFQMHPDVVSTDRKLELIHALAQTGVQSIEVTSFVRPDRVPQHADAAEVCDRLEVIEGVRYRALYLNEKGLLRALEKPKIGLEGYVLLAASEGFLKQNSNISIDDAIAGVDRWLELFDKHQLTVERIMLSTSFGDHIEGRIPAKRTLEVCERAIRRISEKGKSVAEVTFADTTGYGNPESVKRLVAEFRNRFPEVIVGLHLHDTRGTAMANVYAGLQEGVSRFDCSVGGLGGCPFTKGGAGNVPTEDVAFLCEELGITTGLDLKAYIECVKLAEDIVGRPLPGKLKNGGTI